LFAVDGFVKEVGVWDPARHLALAPDLFVFAVFTADHVVAVKGAWFGESAAENLFLPGFLKIDAVVTGKRPVAAVLTSTTVIALEFVVDVAHLVSVSTFSVANGVLALGSLLVLPIPTIPTFTEMFLGPVVVWNTNHLGTSTFAETARISYALSKAVLHESRVTVTLVFCSASNATDHVLALCAFALANVFLCHGSHLWT
jgi:hypothetical protein